MIQRRPDHIALKRLSHFCRIWRTYLLIEACPKKQVCARVSLCMYTCRKLGTLGCWQFYLTPCQTFQRQPKATSPSSRVVITAGSCDSQAAPAALPAPLVYLCNIYVVFGFLRITLTAAFPLAAAACSRHYSVTVALKTCERLGVTTRRKNSPLQLLNGIWPRDGSGTAATNAFYRHGGLTLSSRASRNSGVRETDSLPR